MTSQRVIRLKPLSAKSTEYFVLSGDSSKKIVRSIYGEKEKLFTPFCFADFNHIDGKKFQVFTLDIGYRISHSGNLMPGAHNQSSGNMISYRCKNDFVIRVAADEIINQHRILRLLSTMPEVTTTDMGDMRNAADVVHSYDDCDLKPESFLRSKYLIPELVPAQSSQPKAFASRVQSGLQTLLAKPAVEVEKQAIKVRAPLNDIVASLESLPMDSNRRVIEPRTYVDLVVSRK